VTAVSLTVRAPAHGATYTDLPVAQAVEAERSLLAARVLLAVFIGALIVISAVAPRCRGQDGAAASAYVALSAHGAGYCERHGSQRVRALQNRLLRPWARPGADRRAL